MLCAEIIHWQVLFPYHEHKIVGVNDGLFFSFVWCLSGKKCINKRINPRNFAYFFFHLRKWDFCSCVISQARTCSVLFRIGIAL